MPLNVQIDGANLRMSSSKNVTVVSAIQGAGAELTISTRRPFELSMDLGASDQTQIELGGLPVTNLDVKLGAGQATFGWSRPNPQEMQSFTLKTGAADILLSGLGNSNARKVDIDGGAATVKVDFGGALRRDMDASIRTGMATTES